MVRFVAGRILGAIATLFATAIFSFAIFHLLPGDPAAVLAGQGASPQQVAAIRKSLGLSGNIVQQFATWLERIAHGNLGVSVISNVPVTTLLAQRLPVTLGLIFTSVIVALVTSIPLSLGALHPGGLLDRIAIVWSIVFFSIPIFWLGELLVLVFSLKLGWFPASGFVSFLDSPVPGLKTSLLPSIAFGCYLSAFLIQFLRAALLDVMDEDYIRTARAKGLPESLVLFRHGAKPTMIPFLTVLGILIGTSMGATIIIEQVFNYPGFGSLFVQAIVNRDFYVIQAGILIVVGAVIIANLIVDLSYAFLDPRVRSN